MNTQKMPSLAAKLAKKIKVVNPIVVRNASSGSSNSVQDIEDIVAATGTSDMSFFSPIQTRRQRKTIGSALDKLTKATVSEPKKARESNEAPEKTVLTAPRKTTKKKPELTSVETVQSLSISKVTSVSTIKQNATKPRNEKDEMKPKLKPGLIKSEECGDHNPKWQPSDWIATLDNIRKMRSNGPAPVDTMGCHQCADDAADQKTQRFHKLIALMLSSQTKDETTFEAMKRLKAKTLTPSSIAAMPIGILETLLCPVSFYRNKAKYIKNTAAILIEKYDSDIPNNIKELVALPGVGPKMAHICMSTAWNQTTGIGVDVHVHRIANRLKWVLNATKEPEQTRKALESWLPKDLWPEVNHLLVGFGQTICTPVKPKCSQCLNVLQCPAATKADQTKYLQNTQYKLCPAIEKFEKKLLNIK